MSFFCELLHSVIPDIFMVYTAVGVPVSLTLLSLLAERCHFAKAKPLTFEKEGFGYGLFLQGRSQNWQKKFPPPLAFCCAF